MCPKDNAPKFKKKVYFLRSLNAKEQIDLFAITSAFILSPPL